MRSTRRDKLKKLGMKTRQARRAKHRSTWFDKLDKKLQNRILKDAELLIDLHRDPDEPHCSFTWPDIINTLKEEHPTITVHYKTFKETLVKHFGEDALNG